MNFFERQAQARRTSTRLLVLFALAVAGMVLAAGAGRGLAGCRHPAADGSANVSLLAMTVVALVALAVIGFGSLYRMASLRDGGEAVALQLGGVPVAEDTTDLGCAGCATWSRRSRSPRACRCRSCTCSSTSRHQRLRRRLFALDAAIAVTRGALDRLNRDELQGVVAHEFSHILNGDMRLNIRLIGVLFGILMLGLIGRKVLQHAGRAAGAAWPR
jgi:hypothetical protein